MMDVIDAQPPPLKKLKFQHISMDGAMESATEIDIDGTMDDATNTDATVMADAADQTAIREQLRKEAECGITEFVSPELPAFTGILKKRYTDFLVNEIVPSGHVAHLDNLKAPEWSKKQVDESSNVKNAKTASVGKVPIDQPSTIPSVTSASESNDVTQLHAVSQLAPEKVQPSYSQAVDNKTQGSSQESQTSVLAQIELAPGLGPRLKEKIRMQHTSDGLTILGDKEWDALLQQNSGLAAGRGSSPKLQTETVGNREDVVQGEAPSQPLVQPSTAMAWQAYADVRKGYRLPTEDRELLTSYFDHEVVDSIMELFNRILDSPHRKAKDYGTVKSASITDRELRTQIHQAIRRIFDSRLESVTDDTGAMIISAAAPISSWTARTTSRTDGERKPQQKGKPGWQELGGEYLHFTLYKENKDTMEVISYLARQLKIKAQAFQFAGTKDRRGVTVQRVSVFRVFAERMIGVGRTLRNANVGNYEYQPQGLQLGDLKGNEFLITLRDCKFGDELNSGDRVQKASQVVGAAIDNLRAKGFINYYGLQRFGTFSATTDSIGVKMLQSDFKGAIEAILNYSPAALAAAQDPMANTDKVSEDDKARAYAVHLFNETGKLHPAIDELPRKFNAEANIIRHLSHPDRSNDYQGALQCISRNLRLMYVHAYQSLVWNVAASERWKRHGSRVIAGDLVLVNEHKEKTESIPKQEEIDEDGEAIIYPADVDRAGSAADMFTRARPLSEDEANSGDYSIFDIVLPMPGFDISYPANEMSDVYKYFMASERGGGLDPLDMRRPWKDISLSGSYRKLLARTDDDVSFEIKTYEAEYEQFVQTDVDRLPESKPKHEQKREVSEQDHAPGEVQEPVESGEEGSKIAVVLKMQLGASQYATMALRELMKFGGVQTYKPDFGGR